MAWRDDPQPLRIGVMITALTIAAALQAQPAERHSIFDFIYCVSDAAERLDPSGEPVSVVVDAALVECRPMEAKPAPGSPLASLTLEQQQNILRQMRETVGEGVRKRLVALRACRNTPDCDAASVAPAFDDLPARRQ